MTHVGTQGLGGGVQNGTILPSWRGSTASSDQTRCVHVFWPPARQLFHFSPFNMQTRNRLPVFPIFYFVKKCRISILKDQLSSRYFVYSSHSFSASQLPSLQGFSVPTTSLATYSQGYLLYVDFTIYTTSGSFPVSITFWPLPIQLTCFSTATLGLFLMLSELQIYWLCFH